MPIQRRQKRSCAAVPYFDLFVEGRAGKTSAIWAERQVVHRLLMARQARQHLFALDWVPETKREVIRARHQSFRLSSPAMSAQHMHKQLEV